jgi:hypothetical protein
MATLKCTHLKAIDKIVELYESLLKSEREEVELLQKYNSQIQFQVCFYCRSRVLRLIADSEVDLHFIAEVNCKCSVLKFWPDIEH